MNVDQMVWVDLNRVSGTPCFAGTRVPVKSLTDHLEAGDSLEVFLDDFPTVSREQAEAILAFGVDKAVALVQEHALVA